MTTKAQERLWLFHSHLKDVDESDLIQLYPYMSQKEKVKYQNGFQALNLSDHFPLNNNIPIKPSPLIFRSRNLIFGESKEDLTSVDHRVELVQKLVDENSIVINLNEDNELSEDYEEYDSYIVVIDEISSEVSQLLSELDSSKVNIITKKEVDVDANILIYQNYLISNKEVESDCLKEIESEDDKLCDKKVYEIDELQLL